MRQRAVQSKMEGTAMEASKVYYTDFRCPVGTSLLDKLRRVCIAAGIKDIRAKSMRSNNPLIGVAAQAATPNSNRTKT